MTMTTAPAAAHVSRVAWPWVLRVTAVCTLFGAEAIHTAVITEHINQWLPFGLFFLALSVAEGMLAVALITAPSTWVSRIAIGVSLGTVALWLFSRTLGLPIGPMAWTPEPVDHADATATILELMTAVVLIFAIARERTARATTGTTTRASGKALSTGTPMTALDYFLAILIVVVVVAMATFGATGE